MLATKDHFWYHILFVIAFFPCRVIWILFFLFVTLHLYANFQAVSAVCMETLNQNRFHLVVKQLVHFGKVPTPAVINAMEPVLSGEF